MLDIKTCLKQYFTKAAGPHEAVETEGELLWVGNFAINLNELTELIRSMTS